jgi:hypothetical protein
MNDMELNDIGGFLYYRNQEARAQWAYRWAQQGGSFFHRAHDLQDLRSVGDRMKGRELWLTARPLRKLAKQMHTKIYGNAKGRKVVNLAAFKFDRERQQVAKRLGVMA